MRAQAEERFKTAVAALGDENEGTQVGGAILLRSFLNPNDKEPYGRYYNQILDLAVAYLRLSSLSKPPYDPDGMSPSPEDPNTPIPLTPLRQALITLFKEVFPLARDRVKEQDPKAEFQPQFLDASGLVLDGAYLIDADLAQVWMPGTSLREAVLFKANLTGANLAGANLVRANLMEAKLSSKGTILNRANLVGAHLEKADLREAYLIETDLSNADLSQTKLSGASLFRAILKEANLQAAILSNADLTQADLRGRTFLGLISASPISTVPILEMLTSAMPLSRRFSSLTLILAGRISVTSSPLILLQVWNVPICAALKDWMISRMQPIR